MKAQIVCEHDRMVVGLIVGGIQQRHHALLGKVAQLERRRIARQLGQISAAKFVPAISPMIEPLAQGGAGGAIFHPAIQSSSSLAEATRPQAVDEDARTILRRRPLIDALQAKLAGLFCRLPHRLGSRPENRSQIVGFRVAGALHRKMLSNLSLTRIAALGAARASLGTCQLCLTT